MGDREDGGGAGFFVSYNISSIIDLAAFRSAVAKPSMNR
jgi:hypothetical protein